MTICDPNGSVASTIQLVSSRFSYHPGFMPFTSAPVPRHGYSLIELLSVVAIIGIMALVALPRVRVEQASVDGAVRTVSMALMVAQREAVSRGHNVLVVFDTSHHVVRTVWDRNNNFEIDPGEKTRPFPIPERVVLGRGEGVPAFNSASDAVPSLRVVDDMPAIALQRNGSADRSMTMYFTSARSRRGIGEKDTRAMKFERATGRPTWYVWSGGSWRRN